MARKSLSIVTPAQVRAAFAAGDLNASDVLDAKGNPVNPASLVGANGDGKVRGRLNPAFARAYEAANPGTEVREKVVTSKEVEIPMNSAKTGRPIKPRVLPIAEVRALAGVEGKKGRLSTEDKQRAALALGSGPFA